MLNVEFERMTVPAGSDVTMEVTISTRVNVTSVAAKRQVNRLLLERVGNLLYAEEPNLLVGTRLLWRVPVWLGLPTCGPVGSVGTLDVDAQSGEILFTPQQLAEMGAYGDALAQRAISAAD
jgi:hypothetical protein